MIEVETMPHTISRRNANTRAPGTRLIQFRMKNKYYRLYPNGYLIEYNLPKQKLKNVVAHIGNYRPRALRP